MNKRLEVIAYVDGKRFTLVYYADDEKFRGFYATYRLSTISHEVEEKVRDGN